MKRIALILVTLLLSSGCAHKIPAQKVAPGITKGKTTKQEVLILFGDPYQRHKTPGMKIVSGDRVHVIHAPAEAWKYSVDATGANDKPTMNTLMLFFNPEGVVSSYVFTEEAH